MQPQAFPKGQRLRSKKDFETIFSRGNSCTEFPLKFIWTQSNQETSEFKIGISVPKKRFKLAVDRNRLKRRIRESFRKNSLQLQKDIAPYNTSIICVVVYIGNQAISQQKIQSQLELGLKKIVASFENI